jgi:hypothetical protein
MDSTTCRFHESKCWWIDVKGKHFGSIADVVRNHDGLYMGSLDVVFPSVSDPTTFGVLACMEALSVAQDLNIQRILVSSDCKQVI